MNPKDIIIDPEIGALIQPLGDGELQQLAKNLQSDGCRDALVVWEETGILLDGHNRKEICDRLGILYEIAALSFADHESACDWVDANQLGRRNLTPDQTALIRGRRYNRAKRKQGGTGANQHRLQSGQSAHSAKTADRIAKEHGVNESTVRRDGQFAEAVDRAKAIDPDLPKRIAKGKAPFRKAIMEAADTVKSDPGKARTLLQKTKADQMKERRGRKNKSPAKPLGKFDAGPRYLAILMAVSRELSRIQRIDLSETEKAEFREKVLECLENKLKGAAK